jgi:hypothetical protein
MNRFFRESYSYRQILSLLGKLFSLLYKLKLNLSHYTPRRRLGERTYSSYSFTTSALDEGEWSASQRRALAPGKRGPVPIVQEAGWAPQPVWTQRLEEKSFRLCRGSKLYLPGVQPVARHYTDWATRLIFPSYTEPESSRKSVYTWNLCWAKLVQPTPSPSLFKICVCISYPLMYA